LARLGLKLHGRSQEFIDDVALFGTLTIDLNRLADWFA
jgi:hypothetical protein